jgi:glycosyltransferase involved in cell wall biosynthesis
VSGPDRGPAVSVAIAAHRRPDSLARAIESVLAQTFTNWELIVSDDEDPPAEVWSYLSHIARSDSRIRLLRNIQEHGQVANRNSALRNAGAPWIKVLDHDDELLPDCLETFLSSVEGCSTAVLACCTANFYCDGKRVRTQRRGRAVVELLRQRDAHMAMYLQETGPGHPSLTLVRRSVIAAGTVFEDVPGLVSAVDTEWFVQVLRRGDLVLINEALVNLHQDAETLTGTISQEALDREFLAMRGRQFELIDAAQRPPDLSTALQTVRLIRAANRLKRRRLRDALALIRGTPDPRAWLLAVRWAVQQIFPGRFRRVQYVTIRQ